MFFRRTSQFWILSATAILTANGIWSAAASERPSLIVSVDQGVPNLRLSGPPGEWVEVQSQPIMQSSNGWQSLGYTQLSQTGPVLGAGTNRMYFFRLLLTPASPGAPATFQMGSPSTEDGRDNDEAPQTKVTLTKQFWIADHEVTQGEFFGVMGSNPSSVQGDTNQPVEQVTWDEAQSYCAKRTTLEATGGLIPAGFHYRLPTEAEWEYCARAGTTTRFTFGDDPGYVLLDDYAWFITNSDGTPHDVATKKPNPWGLYDMTGNVWEWCQDFYGGYPSGNQTDPTGPISSQERVVRGGSYYYDGWLSRSAARNSFPANTRNPQVGFRVVLAPQ